MQELLGCAGQVQLLCGAAEVCPCLQHLLLGGLFVKAHEHGSGVTVRDRHTEALRGNGGLLGVDDVVTLDVAPQLQGFALTLFLFAADVGDHVVHDLRHTVKGLSGTGNCLIGAHQSLVHTKFLHQRVQSRHIALQAAVGLDGDEAALGAQTLALCGDDLNMVGIDLGHHHGYIRGEAVGAVVGHHRALCLGVGLFQSLDLVLGHVDGAENEVHLCGDLFHLGSVLHHHPLDALGHRGGHGPAAAHSLFIRFACAAARSSQDGPLEPGMVLQQRNKTLTHHTGCAYDTHFILFFHFQHLSFQKDEQCALWFAQRLENRHSMQYNRYCLYKFYNIIDAVPVSIIGKANAQYVKKRFLVRFTQRAHCAGTCKPPRLCTPDGPEPEG